MQASLAAMTTLGLGGPAKRLVEAQTEDELARAVAEADARGEPVFVLGGGSNVVVGDAGWDGLVVRVASRGVRRVAHEGAAFEVEAGEPWDALARQWAEDGLAGVECLAGIPGLAGATPMQNVGAYGQEVEGIVSRVRAWDRRARAFVELDRAACGFGYRASVFRGSDRHVITRVTFALREGPLSDPIRYAELARALGVREGERAPLRVVRDAVVALRRQKGMLLDRADPETRSAGSFFTNPVVDAAEADAVSARAGAPVPRFPAPGGKVKLPAAWLIERAGFPKGYALGRAHVSRKHALALVSGGGTTEELLALARAIRRGVERAFGVALEPEPVLVACTLRE